MYPTRHLKRLDRHKQRLRSRIARQRAACIQAAGRIEQPLDLFDRLAALWRSLPPALRLVVLPLALLRRAAARGAVPEVMARAGTLAWGLLQNWPGIGRR